MLSWSNSIVVIAIQVKLEVFSSQRTTMLYKLPSTHASNDIIFGPVQIETATSCKGGRLLPG